MIFLEKEKQDIDNKCSTNKMISLSLCKSTNSYCRSIVFHEKEIILYSTASSINSNETISCFSIKDIVLTYFPWTTPEKFIHLCRLKRIIRYKPDKSTNSDLSLRLINIQQLDQYWQFFIQQLSPNLQSTSFSQSELNQQSKHFFYLYQRAKTNRTKTVRFGSSPADPNSNRHFEK